MFDAQRILGALVSDGLDGGVRHSRRHRDRDRDDEYRRDDGGMFGGIGAGTALAGAAGIAAAGGLAYMAYQHFKQPSAPGVPGAPQMPGAPGAPAQPGFLDQLLGSSSGPIPPGGAPALGAGPGMPNYGVPAYHNDPSTWGRAAPPAQWGGAPNPAVQPPAQWGAAPQAPAAPPAQWGGAPNPAVQPPAQWGAAPQVPAAPPAQWNAAPTPVAQPPAAPPPPPPPAPAAPAPDAQADALLLIRAMITAAFIDGQIDPEERTRIMNRLAQAGLAAEDQAALAREFDAPQPPFALIGQIRSPQMAEQFYLVSLLGAGTETEAERAYLKGLPPMLGLRPDDVTRLHQSLRIPPIP